MLTRVARETMVSPVIVRCYSMTSSNVSLYTWYKDKQFKSHDTEDNQSFWKNTSFFTESMNLVLLKIQINLRRNFLYHRLY